MRGYHIRALDGEIGHLDDLYIDDRSWEIRYLFVDTSNWLPREWARRVDWIELLVHVEASHDQIRNSPEFDQSRPISREYEERLAEHFAGVPRR